ncbi:threonine/serine exporter family protein [Salinibacterium sp. NK8237]|uniref:threonine/serine ThrE exporter family protein n=1 Tax=Salinibacterium sp. NK8237 TaxID=2792038 RepID=UPI0027DE410F|nr:threonine/serine exporter family protein [Salinibacterium sp. NK8237]
MTTGNNRLRAFQQRISRSLITMAGGALRSNNAPTQLLSLPGSEHQLSQRHARSVIDLCLRAGEAMLATGASAADVVATVLRISTAYGVTGMHVDITFTSLTVSIHRGMNEDPMSIMRIVKVRTIDYTRLQNVYWLIDVITGPDGPGDVDETREELGAILTTPHPYRRWVVTAGKGILAAGVVVIFGASFVLVLVAALSAALSDVLTRRLERLSVPAFFAQMAAAGVISVIAVFMFWLRSIGIDIPGSNSPTVIVISGIIMLLSGVGLTSAASDAIGGYYVTATARGMEVIMMTLGLAVGISIVLSISLRLGIPVAIGDTLGDSRSVISGMVGSAIIAVGFALASYVRMRLLPIMAMGAALVYAVYWFVLPLASSPGLAPAIAGTAAGVVSYLLYRWLKVPEGATNMVGIIALLPGLALYRGIYALMDSEFGVTEALPSMVMALATGLGLAAGTTIGGFVARRTFGFDRAAMAALKRSRTPR